MNLAYPAILAMCRRHADRLNWSMQRLDPYFPLDENKLNQLNDVTLAILDQFSLRFAKLQDAMGAECSRWFWNGCGNRGSWSPSWINCTDWKMWAL